MKWRIIFNQFNDSKRMASLGTPPWVVWTSLSVMAILIVLPVVILGLTATLVGIVLFIILFLIARILRFGQDALNWLARQVTGRDKSGRRNVKVMTKDPTDFQ